jgi:DNA-binding NarL/FixJ family response regulator
MRDRFFSWLPMRLLLADDHPLFRDALRRVVQQTLPGVVVREAGSVPALLDALEQDAEIALVLLDLGMPGAQGFSALIHLRAQHPTLPVLIVSASEDPRLIRRALRHGAAGFVPKSSSLAVMGTALRAVLDGERWMPPGLGEAALDSQEAELAARVAELTPQQFRVLGMLCSGLLNKQIAYELKVSEATVKAHMTAVLRKFGAHSRTQVALMAARLGIEPLSESAE